MPILPIDLQTLFTQMTQVGKDQSAQKDSQIQQQINQGLQIVKKTEEQDNSVNITNEVKSELDEVTSDTKGNSPHKRHKKESKEEEAEEGKEVFTDPDLGHHIDITG
jgi:hypothetical protein